MTLCYKIMEDLPSVPDEYIELALNTAKETVTEHRTIDRVSTQGNAYPMLNTIQERIWTRDGKETLGRANPRYTLEPYMNEWVDNNITPEYSQIGVATSIILKDSPRCDTSVVFQGPHSDNTRSYCLFYLIESSNEDQYTVFWHERGKGLYRKRNTIIYDYDLVDEIDRIQIPLRKWVYFNTSILHSIENILGSRIAIHVSFDLDPFDVFVKA